MYRLYIKNVMSTRLDSSFVESRRFDEAVKQALEQARRIDPNARFNPVTNRVEIALAA